jgi:hypothetical protein
LPIIAQWPLRRGGGESVDGTMICHDDAVMENTHTSAHTTSIPSPPIKRRCVSSKTEKLNFDLLDGGLVAAISVKPFSGVATDIARYPVFEAEMAKMDPPTQETDGGQLIPYKLSYHMSDMEGSDKILVYKEM